MASEGKRPENRSASTMPADGHVLSVDGKFKTRYDTAELAMAAAVKLKQAYPVIQVAVYDAAAKSWTPVKAEAEPAKT